MSVKEILQSLVDDALVDAERIGTSNYFWAFPSKAANNVSVIVNLEPLSVGVMRGRVLCWFQRKRKLRELEDKLAASEQKKALLEQQVKAAKVGREDSVSDDVEITAHIVMCCHGHTQCV